MSTCGMLLMIMSVVSILKARTERTELNWTELKCTDILQFSSVQLCRFVRALSYDVAEMQRTWEVEFCRIGFRGVAKERIPATDSEYVQREST